MVGWPRPAAAILMHAVRYRGLRNIGARPHMIEPASAIGGEPILGAVAPPCPKSFRCRHEMTSEIDPAVRRLQPRQRGNLDGRVADHAEQLLVVPDIGLERSNIEIADDQRRLAQILRPARHPLEKGELLREFGVERRIGDVAAGGHIDILEPDAARQAGADMPRLAIVLPIMAAVRVERQAAEDRDAVVHALPREQAMRVAHRLEGGMGEGRVVDLGLLQAQDVGLRRGEEITDDVESRADRIDIPGGDLGGGHRARCNPSPPTSPVTRASHSGQSPWSDDPDMERPPFRGHGTEADLAFVTQAGHERDASDNRGNSEAISWPHRPFRAVKLSLR